MSVATDELTRQVIQYLELRGCFVWRNNSGQARIKGKVVRFGCPGSPDVLGLTQDGRWIGVEMKADRYDKLSPDQQQFRRATHERGGIYLVARSFDEFVQEYEEVTK